jgi:Arc/MetJ-type ribon-helix-helix transcriptional regulator
MAFVDDRVAEGRYAFASEVIRAPLRLPVGPEKDRSRSGRKAFPNRE